MTNSNNRSSMRPTRRAILQTAGGLVAAAAIPVARLRAANPPNPIIMRMAAYMADAANHPLPEDVVDKTKQHILDTFAAMISGRDLPPGKVALKFARAHIGE